MDTLVIILHDVARAIQLELGSNSISTDLRKLADELSDLIKKGAV